MSNEAVRFLSIGPMEGIVDLPHAGEMLAEDLSVLWVARQERDDDLRDLSGELPM